MIESRRGDGAPAVEVRAKSGPSGYRVPAIDHHTAEV